MKTEDDSAPDVRYPRAYADDEKPENRVPMSVTVLPSTKSLVKRFAARENTTSSRMAETLMLEAAEARRARTRPANSTQPRKKTKGKKS